MESKRGPAASIVDRPGAKRWGSARRTVLALTLAGGASAALFCGGFALFVGSLQFDERPPVVSTDGIVALTGGAQRIEDAIDLLAKGYGRRLLISGVNQRTGRDEIERLSPGQRAIVQCCVDLGYDARDTVGNAAEIRRWTIGHGFRSLIVVTSNYHLPRALTELDHALPDVRKVPYAVVRDGSAAEGWHTSPTRARLFMSEYVKLIAVWVRTRWRPAGPEGPAQLAA